MTRRTRGPIDVAMGPGCRAIVATRGGFHLVYRLVVRAHQLLDPSGGARGTSWHTILVLSVGLDVALWQLLRRSDRAMLAPRLAIDALDIALWSVAPYPPGGYYALAVLVGVPLAWEAGLRYRAGGLVVPAVHLVAVEVAAHLVGRQARPLTIVWLVGAVAAGAMVSYYERYRLRRQYQRHQQARRHDARLEGQVAVAMEKDNIVDTFTKLRACLLSLGWVNDTIRSEAPHLAAVFGYKQHLGESSAGRFSYLRTELARWRAERLRSDPELATLIRDIRIPEGSETLLLAPGQCRRLREQLNALSPVLRGVVDVAIGSSSVGGGDVGLIASCDDRDSVQWRLALGPRSDERTSGAPFAPLCFVLGAFWVLTETRIPFAVDATLALGCLVAAGWSHRCFVDRGEPDGPIRPRVSPDSVRHIVAAGCALALIQACVTSAIVPAVPHAGYFPAHQGLLMVTLLLGVCRDDFGPHGDRTALWWAAAAVTVGLALSWVRAGPSLDVGQTALSAAWQAVVYFPARTVSLARPSIAPQDLTVQLAYGPRKAIAHAATDAAQEVLAFTEGRAEVLAIARAAFDEAIELFDRHDLNMDARVRAHVQRLFDDLRSQLCALSS